MATERWETHKGDEWWYIDNRCKWSGSFNAAGDVFCVGELHPKEGAKLSPVYFRDILKLTQHQFSDARMTIYLDSISTPLVNLLVQQGLIEFEEVLHEYYREARVVALR